MNSRRHALPAVFLTLFAGTFAAKELVGAAPAPPLVSSTVSLPPGAPSPEPGTFPGRWINGVSCSEPEIQVHAYNDDLYILRQSKCSNYEAPFLYLIFGDDQAILFDTGSVGNPPVADTVFEIRDRWLAAKAKTSIELIVAHTHSHGDHYANDGQFANQPNVTVVGLSLNAVKSFWGFQNYPNDLVQYDLRGRVLDVMGTPGHQKASITVYDRRTQLLLTGDIVYPGHLFIFSQPEWLDFKDSIDRLVSFASARPVAWVVGCHIEMTAEPGVPFKYTTAEHPNEHVLQLDPSVLLDVQTAHQGMGTTPVCRIANDFVIHPVYVCGFFGI